MRDTFWIICNAGGVKAIRKTAPKASDLGLRERAVRVLVEIPAAAFDAPTIPTATIAVPASALMLPEPTVTLDVPPDAPPEVPPDESTAPGPVWHPPLMVDTLDDGAGRADGDIVYLKENGVFFRWSPPGKWQSMTEPPTP